MNDLIFKTEAYEIIGACIEVHSYLGMGFNEVIYKDALEIEFQLRSIPYIREKQFTVLYKEQPLDRIFFVDFWVYGKINLEVKAASFIAEEHIAQTLNYLACSQQRLGLIANFGEKSFVSKRIIL